MRDVTYCTPIPQKICRELSCSSGICGSKERNRKKLSEIRWEFVASEDLLERNLSEVEHKVVMEVENRIIDTYVLYVLFVSESAGISKGVIITHRSVIDYIEWVGEILLLNHNIVIDNQASFYVDNSALDIYSIIRNGAILM